MDPDTPPTPTLSQVRDADLAALENIAGIGMRGWAAMQVYQPEAKQSRSSQRQTMHDARDSCSYDIYTRAFDFPQFEEDVYPRNAGTAEMGKGMTAVSASSSISASSFNSSLASTDSGASLSSVSSTSSAALPIDKDTTPTKSHFHDRPAQLVIDEVPLPRTLPFVQQIPQLRKPIMLNAPGGTTTSTSTTSGVKASTSDPRDLAAKAKPATTATMRSVRKSMPAAALASVFARATLRKSRRLTKAAPPPPASPPKGSPKRSSINNTPSRTQKRAAKTKSAATPTRAPSVRQEAIPPMPTAPTVRQEAIPPMPTAPSVRQEAIPPMPTAPSAPVPVSMPVPVIMAPPPLVPVPSPLLAPTTIESIDPTPRSPIPTVIDPRSGHPSPLGLSPCPSPAATYSRAPSPFLQRPTVPSNAASLPSSAGRDTPRLMHDTPSFIHDTPRFPTHVAKTGVQTSHLHLHTDMPLIDVRHASLQRDVPSNHGGHEAPTKVTRAPIVTAHDRSITSTERPEVAAASPAAASTVSTSTRIPITPSPAPVQAISAAVKHVPVHQPTTRKLAPTTGLAIQMPSTENYPKSSLSASGHLSPRPAYARPRSPSPLLSSTPTIPPPSPQADAPYLELARRAHHARHSSWQIACRLVSRAEEALESHLWSGRDPETAVIRLRIAKEEEEKCRKKVDDAALVLIRLRRGDAQDRNPRDKSTTTTAVGNGRQNTTTRMAQPVDATVAASSRPPAPRQPLVSIRTAAQQHPRVALSNGGIGESSSRPECDAGVFRPLTITKAVRSPQLSVSPVVDMPHAAEPTLRRQASLKRPTAAPRTSSCPTPEILSMPRVPPVPQLPGNYQANLRGTTKDARFVAAPPLLRVRSVRLTNQVAPPSELEIITSSEQKCNTCQGMCLCSAISGWMY